MFQCKDLFNLKSLSKLKLLSDTSGLHRGIRWVYKAESLNLEQWVHGGELLIVSGAVSSNPDFVLSDMLSQAITLNMSGAILLVGPNYIERISKRILQLCNENTFPLFAIPWDLPLVDFFEEIGYAIASNDFHQSNNDDVIFSIVFENKISPQLLALQASKTNYNLEGYQRFFVLSFVLSEKEQNVGMEQTVGNNIREYVSKVFCDYQIPLLASSYSFNIIGLTANHDFAQIQPLFQQIMSYIDRSYPQITYNIGVGLPVDNLPQLKNSYSQAADCITYCTRMHLSNQIYTYNQLGLYQLLSDMDKKEDMELFIQYQLGTLLEYDAANHTQLVDTLYCYLQNNCNILQTANELYTHRNTIKYRLSRIEEITEIHLDDPVVRLNLHVALYIQKNIF